jgi:hypothetical protein
MDTPETEYRMTNGVLFEVQHRLKRRLTHTYPKEQRKMSTSHSDNRTALKRGRVNHTGELAPELDVATTKFLPIPEI